MIWDRGTWIPEGDPHKGYAKGHLAFELDGEKLHGKWHLVRIHGRGKEAKQPWLLIKSQDQWARGAERRRHSRRGAALGGERAHHSRRSRKARARSGSGNRPRASRPMSRPGRRKAIAADPPRRSAPASQRASRDKKGKSKTAKGDARLPDFVPPSLATLRERAPDDPGWVHEVKFDGYRMQARLDRGKVRLLTRKGLDWTKRFPNVAEAVAALPADTALIDGEIIVENDKGVSSFSDLQADLRDGRGDRFVYYVFDLLHLDGRDISELPLIDRKAELQRLVGSKGHGPIKYSEHFSDDGSTMLRSACSLGLEGIVSKRRDAPYRSGRSDAFVKIKCAIEQELVVGGYAPSNVVPRAIGALIVGTYDGGALRYAGRVGTGYTQQTAKELWKRLHPLETDKPPFSDIPREERRAARWVKPAMVIEANLSGGWTADGMVRQAAFKGVREDKPAREVVREVPVAAKNGARSEAKPARAARAAVRSAKPAKTDTEVRFTHPDRVYWDDAGVTKQDLADYYRAVWDWMAPYVVNRPLSFLRCPDGTKGQCFFQKHASAGLSDVHLRTVVDKKRRQIIAIENLDGMLSLVQAGILEVHVRGSTIDRLDLCDRIVFDLDPGEGVPWSGAGRGRARRARAARGHQARIVRQALGRQGPARGAAGRGRRLGDRQDLRAGARHGDGGGRAQALPRQDDEVAARGPHLHRLPAQFAGADFGRRLFDARARRRAGVGAGDVGGTGAHQGRQPIHRAQSRQAACLAQAGPLEGDEPRAAALAGHRRIAQARVKSKLRSLPSCADLIHASNM